jgi:RND family efflux transporter MFP subunit
MKIRKWLIAGLLIASGVQLGCSSQAETKAGQPKPVKAKAVEKFSTGGAARYSASIKPDMQVDLAFKVGGYVESIARVRDASGQWRDIQAGDHVRRGAVLARVRQSDYQAKVDQARSQQNEASTGLESNRSQLKEAQAAVEASRAQLAQSEASLEHARLEFERAKKLFDAESITKSDYDAAKAQYDSALAQVNAAKAQLNASLEKVNTAKAQISMTQARIKTAAAQTAEASIPLGDTELKASMSAVLLQRKVEVGTLVAAGTVGFTLADTTNVKAVFGVTTNVKAVFGVPDLALRSLHLGDTLNITTDAVAGTEFPGHISRISPSADQNSHVFEIEVMIPNPTDLLKPGMVASLEVIEGGAAGLETAVVVPLTAIVRSKNNPTSYAVFVIDESTGQQIARLRDVSLGETVGNTVTVTGGLQAGERVITTGATLVADGEQVQVIP